MLLIINGERISESIIKAEIDRLKPHYQSVFHNQSKNVSDKQLSEWAKENVIEGVLLKQSALNDPRGIAPQKITQAFEKLIIERGGEEKFYQASGLTSEDIPALKFDLEQQLRYERLMTELHSKAIETEMEDATKYYNDHPEQFMLPRMVHAGHIVKHIEGYRPEAEAKAEITEIWEKIQAGTPYEELAAVQTDCAENDGDLGVFPPGQMVQEFEDIVFNLEAGVVSGVFQSPFGYHIAKVFEHHAPRKIDFEEVKQQILEKLTEDRKNEQVEQFVDQLKKVARINDIEDDSKYRKGLSSILVKPAGPDCNLACDYCFYLEKANLFKETKKHRMNEKTLELMIRQTLQQTTGPISFGWQGGEPTLMGLPFFQRAVDFQNRYGSGRSIGNGLQTNGLLIDDEWTSFLKKHNFLVGLSLDGPEHIHDKYRIFSTGKPSWEKVVGSARRMLDAGVAVNVLTVVNDYSAGFPEEIYRFHKSLGFEYMQFIPLVETDNNNSGKAAPYSVDQKAYGHFLCKIFDLWQADFQDGIATTSIRHFDSVFHTYVGLESPECTLLKECGNYVVVEHTGDVYSCDFFVEPEWRLGNIYHDDLLIMLNSEVQKQFGELKGDIPKKCKGCQWLRQCYGGCTKDRLKDPRDKGLSHFCESYKTFFQHADKKLREMAKVWKEQQAGTGGTIPSEVVDSQPPKKKIRRNELCPCGSGKKYKFCCGA